MAKWVRNNPWRQGSIINADQLSGLTNASDKVGIGIVISHDCDLAQLIDREPNAEIIVGRVIDRIEGNFTHAKNPRVLHLT